MYIPFPKRMSALVAYLGKCMITGEWRWVLGEMKSYFRIQLHYDINQTWLQRGRDTAGYSTLTYSVNTSIEGGTTGD